MSNGAGAGPITLRVEFSGLCFYMIHDPERNTADPEDRNRGMAKKFAILMPDARKTRHPVHADGYAGDPHVGYVRFDLANLDLGDTGVAPGIVEDDVGRPRNEIIHRFDGEVLDFGLGDGQVDVKYDLGLPSFNKFADTLRPIDRLFDAAPPSDLLMRTVLSDGEISATGSGKIWALRDKLNGKPNADPYANQFAGYSVWNRTLQDPRLTVTIRKFDGTAVARIPLKAVPVRGLDGDVKSMITIKVANLCSDNPLEWRDDFAVRTVDKEDKDFKWLYRLMEPQKALRTDYATLLGQSQLPYPEQLGVQAFGDEDCIGGSFTTPTPF
jgi:hypothetical protein